jgi:hypothetical protein
MIQRIQSVFLFVSLCFLAPMFFMPSASLISNGGEIYTFNLTGFSQTGQEETVHVSRQISLMLFGILICVLNFITIFMYRRRVLQLRLCIYNIILIIGLLGVMLYVIHVTPKDTVHFSLPIVFPVVSGILHYLAFRGIRRDELMVQALNRLR